MKFKSFFTVALLSSAAVISFSSCNNDDNQPANPYDSALSELFPYVHSPGWEVKGSYHVADFTQTFTEYEVWFDKNAKWVMTEADFGKDIFLVPDNAVTEAIPRSQYGSWTIEDIAHYRIGSQPFYIFKVSTPGQPEMSLVLTRDGNIVSEMPTTLMPEINPATNIFNL